MKQRVDDFLSRVLSRWVDGVDRHAPAVAWGIVAATIVLAVYATLNLGINSSNMSLMPEELPSKQAHLEFVRHFPNLDEAMFIVIDGATPELARDSTDRLLERLQRETDAFSDIYIPGGGDFFERNGLLYRTPEELDDFGDELARVQPLIAEFEQDPTMANVARVVELGLDQLDPDDEHRNQWPLVLDAISAATLEVYDESPIVTSWEELLLQGSSIEIARRRVIVTHPILDYSDILVARRPINRVREVSEELGLVEAHGVKVRLTGNPALNYDEMIGFAWDIGSASLFCFLLVTAVLVRALRSVRLVTAALVTLFTGLIWTMAFASVAVGSLNLLTISFAVIYLGLGVDFGIHIGMGYADALRRGQPHEVALRISAAHVGGALFFCAISTSIGFWVFVPADFKGLAELGMIAGGSMFIIFFLTMTYFPALVSCWLRIDASRQLSAELRFGDGWWNRVVEHPKTVLTVAGLAAVGSAFLLPSTRMDSNVVDMRDPESESVQAMRDLFAEPNNSPWYLNVLAPNLDSAVTLAQKIEALETVDHTVTLQSYIPEQQDVKLEILSDISFLFEPLPLSGSALQTSAHTTESQVASLRDLRDYLGTARLDGPGDDDDSDRLNPLDQSIIRLHDHLDRFLATLEVGGDANRERALSELERVLLGSFPSQIERLRTSLAPEPITLESLPPRLARRMLTDDGVARIQAFPNGDMMDDEDVVAFVHELKAFAPDATGLIVNQVEFAEATERSFYRAMAGAVTAISLLLWLLWRRLSDVVLIMLPLFLGAALTGATMVLLDIPFNFTNVIVIPLLFGIGVDSGIHLIQQEKEAPSLGATHILETSTARAVFYSSLTTVLSFGTMSFAGHRGLQSLGLALTIGLIYTVLSVLFVLPALMQARTGLSKKLVRR